MDENRLNEKTEFSLKPGELICALLMYPAAYIYILVFGSRNDRIWLGVFVLLFIAMTELLNRGRPHPRESWVWLGCVVVMSVCAAFDLSRVWNYGLTMMMVHPLAVWWVLSRSGRLAEGESGHLLPLDALNGFFTIPFGNFALRIRCIVQGLRGRGRGESTDKKRPWAALLAVLAALLLLNGALTELAEADQGFGKLTADILDLFSFDLGDHFATYVFRFIVSLPVGAWIFGLIAGSLRTDEEKLRAQAAAVNGFLPKLRAVPERVWTVVMAVFAVVYFLFFAVQSSYLFGAFTRTLPEDFTVAQYAREGFFELCRFMAINFSLLYLVSRSSAKPIREDKVQRITATLLIVAGIVFAVIAMSKLVLYIMCFGFTPKRLQSSWLVLLLFMGCVACLYSLWTGKKSFKYWMMYGAVSLALLHLY